MGWEDWNVALVQPGKVHSELRALLMKGLNTSVIPSYDAMVERVVSEQVLKLFAGKAFEPRDLIEEYVQLAGGTLYLPSASSPITGPLRRFWYRSGMVIPYQRSRRKNSWRRIVSP